MFSVSTSSVFKSSDFTWSWLTSCKFNEESHNESISDQLFSEAFQSSATDETSTFCKLSDTEVGQSSSKEIKFSILSSNLSFGESTSTSGFSLLLSVSTLLLSALVSLFSASTLLFTLTLGKYEPLFSHKAGSSSDTFSGHMITGCQLFFNSSFSASSSGVKNIQVLPWPTIWLWLFDTQESKSDAKLKSKSSEFHELADTLGSTTEFWFCWVCCVFSSFGITFLLIYKYLQSIIYNLTEINYIQNFLKKQIFEDFFRIKIWQFQ